MANAQTISRGMLLIAFILWHGSATAQGNPTITLESLLAAGRKHHPTLARAALHKRAKTLEHEQLNRNYWPQVSLAGSATWQSDVTSLDIAVPGVDTPTPPKDQYKLALELQQNLWDGGATADRKQVAERHAEVNKQQVMTEWHGLRSHILQLYFQGLAQQELQLQAEALITRLQTVVDSAGLALERGVASERDVLLARARQVEAEQALADAVNRLSGVYAMLAELTGTRLSANATLAPATAACVDGPKEALAAPHIKRPELSLLDAQSGLLDAQQELQEAPDRPRVGLFATAGYGRPGLNALSDEFKFYFIGGLKVSVPLTYLYTGTHGQARDQLALQQALIDRKRDALLSQVRVELDGHRATLSRLDRTIELDAELLSIRERVRKQSELQLSLGTATMTDLINDLTQEELARTKLALHRTERAQTCSQMALTVGTL